MTHITKRKERHLKIVRWIAWDTVRSICIRHKWYTNGTIEEYSRLYDYIKEHRNFTEECILYIATDIYNHSTFSNGAGEIEMIEGIAYTLIGELDYYVEIEEKINESN